VIGNYFHVYELHCSECKRRYASLIFDEEVVDEIDCEDLIDRFVTSLIDLRCRRCEREGEWHFEAADHKYEEEPNE